MREVALPIGSQSGSGEVSWPRSEGVEINLRQDLVNRMRVALFLRAAHSSKDRI